MKKLNYLFIAICSSTILFNSCTLFDVVDELPPNAMTPENVIYNEKSAENVMIGCYGEFRKWGYNDALLWSGSCQAGLLKEGERDNLSFTGETSYMANEIGEGTQQAGYFWEAFYKTIDRVNNLEEILNGTAEAVVNKEAKERILGEARFLRAHTYLHLLRNFAYFWDLDSEYGVVLRTEPSSTKNISMARSSVKDVYHFILEDLDYAIKHAPVFKKEGNYRGNRLAALALKARVLMDIGQYKEAALLADEVIKNNDGVVLEGTYADCFAKNHDSKELIFGRKLDAEAIRYDNQKWIFKNSGLILSDMAINLLKDDPRYTAIAGTAISDDEVIGMRLMKSWNEQSDFGTIFIRLSEMYLIKAEGLIRSGSNIQEGVNALNTIRQRAGITTPLQVAPKEQLLNTVFSEILTELSFENGHEWIAMIRFDKVASYKPGVDDRNRWMTAIPSSEIEYNYLCKQNPHYISR